MFKADEDEAWRSRGQGAWEGVNGAWGEVRKDREGVGKARRRGKVWRCRCRL